MKGRILLLILLISQPAIADSADNIAGIAEYKAHHYEEAEKLFRAALDRAVGEDERNAAKNNLDLALDAQGKLPKKELPPLPAKPKPIVEPYSAPYTMQPRRSFPSIRHEQVEQPSLEPTETTYVLRRGAHELNDSNIQITANTDPRGRIVGEIINHSNSIYDKQIVFSGVLRSTGQRATVYFTPPHLKPGDHYSFTVNSYDGVLQSCTVEEW